VPYEPCVDMHLSDTANHVDLVDMTVGLHAQLIHYTLCRVAGVSPLTTEDCPFQSEVLVQLEQRF
jgi:hypothetical protein